MKDLLNISPTGSSMRQAGYAILFALIFSCTIPSHADAQPVLGARNLSLGGGGTAYLSGIESNFINPANLAIYDRKGFLHIHAGGIGTFFEPVLSVEQPMSQFNRYTARFAPLNPAEQQITAQQRTQILESNYPNTNIVSEHFARGDMLWGGLQWQKNGKAFSLSLRTRMGSRINVGRGWYSFAGIDQDDRRIREMTLVKQHQVYHEISLGFAQELTFLNGLIPRINKFYFGIAPKFVIGGAYQNAVYDARYVMPTDQPVSSARYEQKMSYYSAGSISDMTDLYAGGQDVSTAVNMGLGKHYNTRPTGYGAGLDFGITYVLPLGKDVSLLDSGPKRKPVGKSLRIGISLTDIGVVSYSETPRQYHMAADTVQIGQQTTAETKFIGAMGQFFDYFSRSGALSNPIRSASSVSRENFMVLLPTTLNAGAVLDVNRAKIMGDLSIGLRNTALTNTKLTARFGMETRPLPFLPLRFGTALAADKPIVISAGTGVELENWTFSIGTQVLLKSSSLNTDLVSGAVSALQFHF